MAEAVTKLPTAPERIAIHFPLGDTIIDGATIKTLMYAALADQVAEAQALKQPKMWEARLKRVRMVRQVTYFSGPATIQVSIDDIAKMPIPAAHIINAKLDRSDTEGKAGKVIRPGDGIEQAITYELGTPIAVGQGKEPIRELEFLAHTYGDIEEVLSEPSPLKQTMLLISTIGKPLGTSLTALPSWAMSQITIADGATISNEVMPHFLGSADGS